MTTEANKALVRRFFEEIFPSGDSQALREVVSADILDHDPLPGQPPGVAGIDYVVATLRTAQPDLRFTVDDLVGDGDRVAVRWTQRGTQTGPMLGQPPNGQAIEHSAVVILRIGDDGKIAERWAGFRPGVRDGG